MTKHHIEANTDTAGELYSFYLVLCPEGDEQRYELWLPAIAEGFYRFSDATEHRFLGITARDGQWFAVCRKPAFFRNAPMEYSYEYPLQDVHLIDIAQEEQEYTLYVQRVHFPRMIFQNYHFRSDAQLTIGSGSRCDIQCQDPHMPVFCAQLALKDKQWHLQINGNVPNAFVNGRRCETSALKLGDVIDILGLRIVAGPNLLSIRDLSGSTQVQSAYLREEQIAPGSYSQYNNPDAAEAEEVFFNRMPRKRTQVVPKTITVEGPPMSMERSQMPLFLRMGSSMVMGGASALAGNFMTLLTSVLFPFLSSKYTDKQRQDYERLRLSKYTEYLEIKREEILQACREEQELLNNKYPSLEEAAAQTDLKTRLWERRPGDNDFLCVRLGLGASPLGAQIDYPPKRFELTPDALEEQMYQLVEQPYLLEQAPVVLSLTETRACGLLGPRQQVLDFIEQLVLRLAVFHSYDEVKLVFLLNDSELERLDSIRYLPHTWDDQRSMRFIATNEAQAYALGEYIKGQTAQSENRSLPQLPKNCPCYLIFALGKKLLESHEVFKDILQSEKNPGASIIAAYDDLPKETQKIITLQTQQINTLTSLDADGGEDTVFALDHCSQQAFSEAMRRLANTSLKAVTQTQSLPKMVTFLEMFKTGRIEQLNPLKRWRENNPVTSLATPVGVSADGSLFTLDLHEKRQGPHGLVAGMTGSGKSEFIITYILSMAVNYHPDEVAFVLIDYKGGGLAGAFENPQTGVRLPHLAGTITNLDGASIQRSLMSIESELIRRQRILNEVKSTVNEGTMDIYAYQKLYRAGKVAEPMPHLLIISDEFAELKQQQPEFMAKLISAARIGRSLGVHLILATQKPSGVVDDQIRSNTKFRVCLRVQERSDSMDMLKRPEAAELTDTGRFYLQVGYNEYFALGQSAWCGAAYEPQDTVAVQRDDTIEFLDTTGQIITKAKPKVKKTDSGMKQIVAVVKYLSDLANAHGIKVRQLCRPALPRELDMDALQTAHSDMTLCMGLLDDPENQQQFPMQLDFESCQNLLVTGDSGSGKTVLLQNILLTLAKRLTPKQLNFYILDYSSRMLKLLKPLPHCGAVLQEEDEGSLDEFFKLINSLISERKQLFSELEVDSFEAARVRSELPLILVVIDNIASLGASKKGEAHIYKLQSYLKNSANYGVKYIITSSHLNEVSSRIRQELGERICLHMKDKYDYSEALGCKVSYIPPQHPGRGLCKYEERPLEFQSAILTAGADEKARTIYIKDAVQALSARDAQVDARQLPVYSETATYEEFARQFKRGRIPLGYSKQTGKPIALPLKQFSALSLYFGNPAGKKPLMENMILAAKREGMALWLVKRKENSLFGSVQVRNPEISLPEDTTVFTLDMLSMNNLRSMLTSQVSQRNTLLKEYCLQEGLTGEPQELYKKTFDYLRQNTTPIMLLIESYADFCEAVDSISAMLYDKCFSVAQRRNIYVIGGFEPDDYSHVESKMLYSSFNPDMNVVLLGGQFSKQRACALPDIATVTADKLLPCNTGLICYQNRFHPLVIPRGELPAEEMDEDEKSIFD